MARGNRNKKKKRQVKKEKQANNQVLFDELSKWERENRGANGSFRTLEMARKARESQGQHECDISFNGVVDLHKGLVLCAKNPGHKQFIPAFEFSLPGLPKKFRNQDVYNCVNHIIKLTVLLNVKHTSEKRPDQFGFAAQSGKGNAKHVRRGSGCAFIPMKRAKDSSSTRATVASPSQQFKCVPICDTIIIKRDELFRNFSAKALQDKIQFTQLKNSEHKI